MNYFSIAAIFKHEEPYIGDWVKYHLGIGADHIWLYDNDSPDRSAEIAKDIGGDRVTIEKMPGHPVQSVAYEKCLVDHRRDSRWIGFIDVDEYLYTKEHLLVDTLKNYEIFPAVCPHWILFGSNNLLTYDDRPVPVRFTRCQPDVNRHIKSIVDPTRTIRWVTAHKFVHTHGLAVDENRRGIDTLDSTPDNATACFMYLAHYVVKSKAECTDRRSRPRADTGEHRYNVEEFFNAHDRNEMERLDILNRWNTL